jgi:hypothetical protein
MAHPTRRLAVALLVLAPLGVAACSSDDVADRIAEEAIESGGGDANVDINSEDGSVSVDTEDGSFSFGDGEVPEEWPADIPLPEGLTVLAGSTIEENGTLNVSVTGNVDATAAEIAEFYKGELSDWEVIGDATSTVNGTESVSLQLEDGMRGFQLIMSSGSGEEPTLTISYTERAE